MLIDKKVTKKKLLNVCECVYKWVCDKTGKNSCKFRGKFWIIHCVFSCWMDFFPLDSYHCGIACFWGEHFHLLKRRFTLSAHKHTQASIDKVAIFIFTYQPKKRREKWWKSWKQEKALAMKHAKFLLIKFHVLNGKLCSHLSHSLVSFFAKTSNTFFSMKIW